MAAPEGDASASSALSARVQGVLTHAVQAAVASLSGLAAGDAGGDGVRDRPERVLSASFGVLESPAADGAGAAGATHTRCLFLTYETGWQAWSVERGACRELISLRDGAVTGVLPVPHPERHGNSSSPPGADAVPADARPLVAVAGPDPPLAPLPAPEAAAGDDGDDGAGAAAAPPPAPALHAGPSCVRFFSVRRQGYLRTLPFRSPVLGLRATSRVVAVALESQVYGLDAATLEARAARPHACITPV